MPSGPQESNNQKTNEDDSEITPQPPRFRTSISNCVSLQSHSLSKACTFLTYLLLIFTYKSVFIGMQYIYT